LGGGLRPAAREQAGWTEAGNSSSETQAWEEAEMTSRSDMLAAIIDEMDRDLTADGPAVLKAISAAIRFYQPKRFWFNESRETTFSTVAGTSAYTYATIGATYYRTDRLELSDGSDVWSLDDVTPLHISRASISGNSRPQDYAYLNETLYLLPPPDAAYAARIVGHIKLAEPADDATEGNAWFEDGYDLIKSRAKAELYLHRWQDAGNAQAMAVAEAGYLAALREATEAKIAPGYFVATDF
jgi:hypothetical protein